MKASGSASPLHLLWPEITVQMTSENAQRLIYFNQGFIQLSTATPN